MVLEKKKFKEVPGSQPKDLALSLLLQGSIPALGTFAGHGCSQKKKKKGGVFGINLELCLGEITHSNSV